MAANAYTVTGFWWRHARYGGDIQPVEERTVASNNSTAIFRGDLVKLVNDGTVTVAAAGDAASHVVVGVMRYKDSSGIIRSGNFLPASTTYSGNVDKANPQASVLQVTPIFGQVFECSINNGQASVNAATTLINNNADIVATAGSTTTGVSGFQLDTAAMDTTARQFRILELVMDPTNDPTKDNWRVLVTGNLGNDANPLSTTGV